MKKVFLCGKKYEKPENKIEKKVEPVEKKNVKVENDLQPELPAKINLEESK